MKKPKETVEKKLEKFAYGGEEFEKEIYEELEEWIDDNLYNGPDDYSASKFKITIMIEKMSI